MGGVMEAAPCILFWLGRLVPAVSIAVAAPGTFMSQARAVVSSLSAELSFVSLLCYIVLDLAVFRRRFMPAFYTFSVVSVLAAITASVKHLSPLPALTLSLPVISAWAEALFFLCAYLAGVFVLWAVETVASFTHELDGRNWWWQLREIERANASAGKDGQRVPMEHVHFFNERFACPAADAQKGHTAPKVPFTPVFISGLHRSGTTFLYERLVAVTRSSGRVAYLSPFALFAEPRLLTAHQEGTLEKEMDAFNEYLRAIGLRDRAIDSVAVSATNPPEEYAYIISRKHFSGETSAKTAPLVASLCEKLATVQVPKAAEPIVLLKNPFDMGREEEILRLFPNAKFIFIWRSPGEILESALHACHFHVGINEVDPYLWLVAPSWSHYLPCLERLLYCFLGEARYYRYHMSHIMRFYSPLAASAARVMRTLPKDKFLAVHYDTLVADTASVVSTAVDFLGVPVDAATLHHHTTGRATRRKLGLTSQAQHQPQQQQQQQPDPPADITLHSPLPSPKAATQKQGSGEDASGNGNGSSAVRKPLRQTLKGHPALQAELIIRKAEFEATLRAAGCPVDSSSPSLSALKPAPALETPLPSP